MLLVPEFCGHLSFEVVGRDRELSLENSDGLLVASMLLLGASDLLLHFKLHMFPWLGPCLVHSKV